jgi:hypothetical protein
MNIPAEFEKRYTGNIEDTEVICKQIAEANGLDVDYVIDYVCIHRYEDGGSEEADDIPS